MGFSPVPEICLFPQNVFRIGQNSEIFLKINTSTIKSSKNINQTIHSTSFIFIFFGFFTFFSRLRIWFLEKITTLLCHSWSQILLSNHQSKIYNTIHVDMFCSLEKNKNLNKLYRLTSVNGRVKIFLGSNEITLYHPMQMALVDPFYSF